jgi:hypothetical protein
METNEPSGNCRCIITGAKFVDGDQTVGLITFFPQGPVAGRYQWQAGEMVPLFCDTFEQAKGNLEAALKNRRSNRG